jgi:hypothetical protein
MTNERVTRETSIDNSLHEAYSYNWLFPSKESLLTELLKATEGIIVEDVDGVYYDNFKGDIKKLNVYYCKLCGYVKGVPDLELGKKYCYVCEREI